MELLSHSLQQTARFTKRNQNYDLKFNLYEKVKAKLSLCLTKHHAMKAYWGSAGIAPFIL
jgi:hypothetical protein